LCGTRRGAASAEFHACGLAPPTSTMSMHRNTEGRAMGAPSTGLMTAEEFFAWCGRAENRDKRYELERGKVVEVPFPSEVAEVAGANADSLVSAWASRQGAVFFCSKQEIIWERSPDTVLKPALVCLVGTRGLDENRLEVYVGLKPLLVVEVLSPHDRWTPFMRRVLRYLRSGVPLLWVLDPVEQWALVFRAREITRVLSADEELTGEDVLPAFRCRVADFFTLAPDVIVAS
jgi:Uma2 family endonuclease